MDYVVKMEDGRGSPSVATTLEGSSSHANIGTESTRFTRFLDRVRNIRKGRVSPSLVDGEALETGDLSLALENLGYVDGESENGEVQACQWRQRRYSSLPNIPNALNADQRQHAIPKHRLSAGSSVSKIRGRRFTSVLRRLQKRSARLSAQEQKKSSGFLPYFLAILFYVGIDRLYPALPNSNGTCHRFGENIQTAAFVMMSTVAMLKALVVSKDKWIEFRLKKSMLQFISLGYSVSNLVTRGSMIILFSRRRGETLTLMSKVKRIHAKHVGGRSWANRTFPAVLVFLSVAASVAQVVFAYYSFDEWTFYGTQQVRAYDTAESILVWSPNNYDNVTDIIEKAYSTNFTTVTYCLASVGNVLAFTGTLYESLLLDLFLLLSLEIYYLQKPLIKDIQLSGSACPLSVHWDLYAECRHVCDLIDDIFGPLLKLLHFKNMFFFADLLLHFMTITSLDIWCVIAFYSLIRMTVAYYLLWKTSNENQKMEEALVVYWKNHVTMEINGTAVNIQGVLKDMKSHPIGLGRGEFFVNETFILKMLGAIGTIFMFLSDAQDKESFKPTY